MQNYIPNAIQTNENYLVIYNQFKELIRAFDSSPKQLYQYSQLLHFLFQYCSSTQTQYTKLQNEMYFSLISTGYRTQNQEKANKLLRIIDKCIKELKNMDKSIILTNPVEKEYAPDYYKIIKHPMCLNDMKRSRNSYTSFERFESDYDLMIRNGLRYNPEVTEVYKYIFDYSKKTKNIVESHKQMYQNTLHSIVFAMTRSLYTSWKKRSSPLQMKRMEPRSLPFYVTSPYYATMGHYIHLCILLFMMWLWKWYRTRRSFTIRMIFLTIHRSLFIYCSWPLSQNFVDLSSRELKYMIVEEFDWVEANGV